MQIALNSGIFPVAWDPAQKVEATARVGAAGMELNIDATHLWTQRLDPNARRALRRQAADAGVAITSLCLNAHWVFNLASPDVRIRDIGISQIMDAIDMAEALGAGAILVPGCDQDESPENSWQLFRDGLMHAIARAEQAGVTLALEAVGKPFLLDTARLMAMITACGGSTALGIYLDVGNSTSGGMDPALEVLGAKGRATLCHVKDWNPHDRTDRRLGAGGVDFERSFAALREIGYNSYIIVELPPHVDEPDAVARHSIEFLKGVLNH